MGMLDGFMDFLGGGVQPSKGGGLLGLDLEDPRLALAMQLLSTRKGGNLAAPFLQYGAMQSQRKRDARADQSAEMQRLQGTYQILKQQDSIAREQANWNGTPYTPNPLLQQHEARLAKLMGMPDSGQPSAVHSLPAFGSGERPGPTVTGNGAIMPRGDGTLSTPEADGLLPQGFRSQQQGLLGGAAPMPGAQQPQPPTLRDAARAANIPDSIAVPLIQQGKSAELYKLIAEALRPHNGPGGISRVDPRTGEVQIMGGSASPGQVPWSMRNGTPTAMPIQGAAEEVARARGLETRATEDAKAGFDLIDVPMGNGQTVKMPRSEYLRLRQQSQPQAPMQSPGLPPNSAFPSSGRTDDANTRAILAQELRDNPNDPHLRREIQGRFPDLLEQRGQVGVTPNPLAMKAAEALNDDFLKSGYRPILDAGKSADTVLARVQALKKNGYLDSTGWASVQKVYAANMLAAFGVKDAARYAGDAQTFRKFVMDANWELLNQAKGPQTEGDAQRALQTFAQLENTPRANKFILDFTAATARLAKDKAAFFSAQVQARKGGGDLSAIEGEWQQRAPSIWEYPELKGRWSGGNAANDDPRSVTLPSGQVMRFPSLDAARAFRKQAGIE